MQASQKIEEESISLIWRHFTLQTKEVENITHPKP